MGGLGRSLFHRASARCILSLGLSLLYGFAGRGISGGKSTGGGRSGAIGRAAGTGVEIGTVPPGAGKRTAVPRPAGSSAGVAPRTARTGGSSTGTAGAAELRTSLRVLPVEA